MTITDDIKRFTDPEIEKIIREIDVVNKKGKEILYLSFVAPWLILTLWKLLAYAGIAPGFQIESSGIYIFIFIFLFLVSAYLLIALPFYLLGLFIIWRPLRKSLPSLPFFGCFSEKGYEQLKEKLHDVVYSRNVK